MLYKSFHFNNERLNEILQAVRCTFHDCINTIYQFIKPFLDNKMSILEKYGTFKNDNQQIKCKGVLKICDINLYLKTFDL